MTPGRPRVSAPPATKARLHEPDGAAGGDFVWPPPADDPAACSIVLLETAAGDDVRPRAAALADDVPEPFPEIDLDTALDQFADFPAPARVSPATQPAAPQAPHRAQPPARRWHGAALRTVVALGIGTSLALMPPPGLTRVVDARPLDAPAKAEPRVTATRNIATPQRVRAVAAPVAEPKPVKVVPRDEDRIRTTLAELRAAYSQLDAGAAREVWPSLDVEALALTFDGLKSQELRFDHCDVTIDGARAVAACTGEAIYVPRVGNEASSAAALAWTFELTRQRERWMIASARAS